MANSVFPDDRVLAFERLGNGFSNSNYKVYIEGVPSPIVFRLYASSKGIATKEQRISKLVGPDVPVAAYLHVDESCSLIDVPFAILEWRSGVLLSDLMRTSHGIHLASAAESVGKVLAQIHKHEFPKFGFLNERLEIERSMRIDEDEFHSLITHFIGNSCGIFLGEGISKDVLAFCKNQGHNLSEDLRAPVLVHSDYNGLNILINGNSDQSSVSAVLDWEYAFSGSRYADIGNMLRYEKDGSVFETNFLRGYEGNGGVLKDNWRILSRLHDLIALCDLLDRSSSETPRRVQDLRYLIGKTVRNY